MIAFANTAYSEPPPDPRMKACIQYKIERAAAIDRRDWNSLESAAVKFIEGCEKVSREEDLSKANAELSMILRNRNDPKNALEFASRAIFHSKEPDSHIEKAIVFAQLNRIKEAGLEFDVAELMAKLALKHNELRIRTYATKDPVSYAKQKQHYEAVIKLVNDSRKQYITSKPRSRKQ